MRVCASICTSIVLNNPNSAAIFTNGASHRRPVASMPTASGSATSSRWYGTMPSSTTATAMYSTVQTASDPRMPIGMSRAGFFASCAAVDTASKPMYAKNITPAPRSTPLQPNDPNAPVFGGTNGVRFARFTYTAPAATNTTSTATLITTSTVFAFADSLMPTMSSADTSKTMTKAGALKPTGAPDMPAGPSVMPTSRARLTK